MGMQARAAEQADALAAARRLLSASAGAAAEARRLRDERAALLAAADAAAAENARLAAERAWLKQRLVRRAAAAVLPCFLCWAARLHLVTPSCLVGMGCIFNQWVACFTQATQLHGAAALAVPPAREWEALGRAEAAC